MNQLAIDPTTQRATQSRGLDYTDTVAHRIAAGLKRHGVNCLFGQSLPSMVHLAGRNHGIRQIAYRQENTGGYMADAYARLSGQVGVVTAQNGPAAALLVAPLLEALKVSIPLIALVQDVNRDQTDRNAFQEIDHEAMFRPCAKWVRRVTEASRIDDYLDMAFTAATSGRPGPAVLLLPADLLLEPAPAATARSASLGRYPLDRALPDSDSLDAAAALLAQAENPVVIAGGGVHLSGAAAELARLQESASLPVATTVMGKGGVDEGHALSIGVASYFTGPNGGARYLKPLVTDADVVLLVGNRTNQNGTDSWKLYPKNARFIHIDVEPMEVGRNYEAMRLIGDARLTLAALSDRLERGDLSKRRSRRAAVEAAIRKGHDRHRDEVAALVESSASPMRPERIMSEIDKRLTPESIVVADASYSSIWVANYMHSRRAGMRFITPRGLAGLGWGLPMSLGARVAKPDAPIFCVVGDGGFAHAWAELETAVRMKLRVVLVVLNNGILGYQKHAENVKFGAFTDACDFVPVDHAAIARAVGARGVRVEKAAELGPALDAALSADTMTLIDVVTDENAFPPVSWYEVT
ncbi:acetolactate synthase catalytic subunit [Variovorax sp. J22P240]|uniref:acetolactate synthase catalytic subunit n=1 Tax=Variovorax sp. J22P240 TaxID=3053514 RepID=UPI0025761956|nr:acetolactate synthase catalytic subunit [Variovorax sp. J22P240]MDM0001767.1 acetolactate synthase catalytic subunit [Variovorax sp. J22P240]